MSFSKESVVGWYEEDMPTQVRQMPAAPRPLWKLALMLVAAVWASYIALKFEWRVWCLEQDAREFHQHTTRIRHLEEDVHDLGVVRDPEFSAKDLK